MSKFIWVRDIDKREHFINADHIARVTKVPPNATLKSPGYAYLIVADSSPGGKEIRLWTDGSDSFEDVIEKIQAL